MLSPLYEVIKEASEMILYACFRVKKITFVLKKVKMLHGSENIS